MGSTEPLGAEKAGTVDGSNLTGVPGGAGVSSVNTRAGAIVLLGSASVVITEGPVNTFTFTAPGGVGVSSFNTRTGAIVEVAGPGISIVEAPANTFTVNNTGVLSFDSGGPARTGAIHVLAGANITIIEGPVGTFTISTAGVAGGITSINADPTPAQIIGAIAPITMLDAGNVHNVGVNDFTAVSRGTVPTPPVGVPAFLNPAGWQQVFGFSASAGPGAAIPAAPSTTVVSSATIPVGQSGSYQVSYGAGLNGITGNIMGVVIFLNGAPIVARGFSGLVETTGQTCTVNGSLFLFLSAGDVIDVRVTQAAGAGATTATASHIDGYRINI